MHNFSEALHFIFVLGTSSPITDKICKGIKNLTGTLAVPTKATLSLCDFVNVKIPFP